MSQFNERLVAIEEWRTTQLAAQILAMEEWRAKQIKLSRRVLKWLALGLVLFMLAGVVAFWQYGNLVESNRMNIARLAHVDKALAVEQYHAETIRWNACVERNEVFRQQLRQDKRQLKRLYQAHLKDGSIYAAAVWKDYLAQGEKTKLPNCGPKPEPPPPPP